MHDDDIICGSCGKRNDAARVTCWNCKETLEEEERSSGTSLRFFYKLGLVLALLAVASMLGGSLAVVSGLFRR